MLTREQFTPQFCRDLVAQHGGIDAAAKAIAPTCKSSRYKDRTMSWMRVKEWISAGVGGKIGVELARPADPDRLNRIAELLERANIDPESIGSIRSAKVKAWGYAMKGPDGNPVEGGLHATELTLDPLATYTQIIPRESPITAYKVAGARDASVERVAIVGDVQIGFWAVRSPEDPQKITFEPFHDEVALDVMMQALALYKPDRVVIVGDFLDFPQLSRFQQEPEWGQTLQASIQEAHDLLAKIRKTVGAACAIDFLPGNHETRMTRAIVNNNPALYNLTRPGEKWPVYSVPSLLRFEAHGVECAAEYPSGEVWLAKRRGNIPGLVVTHADPKKKEMRADAIHGHLVLPGIETRQVFYEDGPVTYTRMCVSGCGNYSDTGDKVRLTRTNTPSGRSRMSSVPSFGTVDIDRESGLRSYGLHLIIDGAVHFRGRVISSALAQGSEAA